LKVLNVIATVDPRDGGPIAGLYSSSEVWRQNGHERTAVCFDPPDAPWLGAAPLKVFALGHRIQRQLFLRRIFPWLRYGYTPRLMRWLKAHAGDYDVVIVNGLWNYNSFGTWRALGASGTPYVVFTHGMLDPWFNKAHPIKSIFKTIFWKLFEHRVLRDARGVLFTCEEERRLASQAFSPYSAREFVVGYGARPAQGDPVVQRRAYQERVPALQSRKFLLFLSRIHPKKGIELLIEGFARICGRFPDLDLVIAGPDGAEWEQKLRKMAERLGVAQRIHWPGMLSGDVKWGAFRAAEFFVLPSHQENFGIVVAEALSLSKPVLITNKVNIWREIEQDGAGIVVNDDIEAVADGLERMCSLPDTERLAMGERALTCFQERYDMDKNAMSFLTLLRGILDDKLAA